MCCLFFSISIVFAFFCYLCPFCLVLFFFFFKQKTAYERRISYWSSDVCSSDLFCWLGGGGDLLAIFLAPRLPLLFLNLPLHLENRPALLYRSLEFRRLLDFFRELGRALNCRLGNAVLFGEFGCGASRWINLIFLHMLVSARSALRPLLPVIPTTKKQLEGVRRQVAAAKLVGVDPILGSFAIRQIEIGRAHV